MKGKGKRREKEIGKSKSGSWMLFEEALKPVDKSEWEFFALA